MLVGHPSRILLDVPPAKNDPPQTPTLFGFPVLNSRAAHPTPQDPAGRWCKTSCLCRLDDLRPAFSTVSDWVADSAVAWMTAAFVAAIFYVAPITQPSLDPLRRRKQPVDSCQMLRQSYSCPSIGRFSFPEWWRRLCRWDKFRGSRPPTMALKCLDLAAVRGLPIISSTRFTCYGSLNINGFASAPGD